MSNRTRLRVNEVEEQEQLHQASHEIIAGILKEHGCTLIDIAETIGATATTIGNAFNKRSVLSSPLLKRIGDAYGPHALDPWLGLFNGRGVPVEAEPKRDILPVMTRAQLRIVEARDPASPGGPRETLQEQSAFLPDLVKLQSELEAVICDIRRRLAA